MKPLIHYNPMTDITKAEQKKLCRCSTLCKMFVIITYTRGPVLTMCETETKRYVEDVAKAIGFTEPKYIKSKKPWTREEIEKLKKQYQEHSGSWGYLKAFSIELGRTSDQVRQKIRYLKEKGEL